MPITLITGLPGHGKSIHAVRIMRELSRVAEDCRKKIYACNFTDLDYDGLGVQEFDAHQWMKCDPGKHGGVLFFDEVWEFFESRSPHKMPPEAVKELARHRHYGLDIYMITQGPFQIDSHVRALVDTHLHCIRPFGMKFYNVRTFQGIERFPDDKQARKRSADTTKRISFDKKLFGFYKSAEIHTIKRKIPLKLIGALVVIVLALLAIVNLVTWGVGFKDKVSNNSLVERVSGNRALPGSGSVADGFLPQPGRRSLSAEQLRNNYYVNEVPLIEGAPWTAPKYAPAIEVVSFPKPYCVLVEDEDRCFCISQQGTKMDVSDVICRDLVTRGFFDPTIDTKEEQQRQLALAEQYGRQQGVSFPFEFESVSNEVPGIATKGPVFTSWKPKEKSLMVQGRKNYTGGTGQ